MQVSQAAKRMTHSSYYSHKGPETFNWGRVCGIAFAVTVQSALFMMLLVPPSVQDTTKDDNEVHAATIIEPPPPPPPPPPVPKEIPKIIPKEVPPPPQHVNLPPPPAPPPVVTDTPTPMSVQAPPPQPPAPPQQAVNMEAGLDLSYQKALKPDYPREELNAGIDGEVVLLVYVDENGSVTNVTIEKSSHNHNLDRAAMDAAKKAHFNPRVENGKKVPGVARIPVEFKSS